MDIKELRLELARKIVEARKLMKQGKSHDATRVMDEGDEIRLEIAEAELDDGGERFYGDIDTPFVGPIETRTSSQPVSEYRSQGGLFSTLGEQLQEVARAEISGNQPDKRLYQVAEQRAATGLSEGISTDGGFLVQTDFTDRLLQNMFSTGEVARRAFRVPISGNSNGLKVPLIDETSRADGSRFGGARGYWVAEAGTITASKPKIRQASLELSKVAALIYTTDELLDDASALSMFVDRIATSELAFKVDDAIIRGDGAGKPLGILNAAALVPKQAYQLLGRSIDSF